MADVPPRVAFSAHLKQLREARRWSLRELSRRSGISFGAISKIENGGGTTVDSAAAIARALGTTIGGMLTPHACGQCLDAPPPGYDCRACGAHGQAAASA